MTTALMEDLDTEKILKEMFHTIAVELDSTTTRNGYDPPVSSPGVSSTGEPVRERRQQKR